MYEFLSTNIQMIHFKLTSWKGFTNFKKGKENYSKHYFLFYFQKY